MGVQPARPDFLEQAGQGRVNFKLIGQATPDRVLNPSQQFLLSAGRPASFQFAAIGQKLVV